MAFQQYFVQEWKPVPSSTQTPTKECENTSSVPCFDCSICLDFAQDPVVTLCGHLYCWPCIYKWFDVKTSDELPQCPVCKAEISEKTVVPLYGRGKLNSASDLDEKIIPPRPPACGIKGLNSMLNPENQIDRHQNTRGFRNSYNGGSSPPPLFNIRDSASMDVSYPGVGMFGEMVYGRVFGNAESLYTYPNSYQTVRNTTPRLRRRELQANESLNRVYVFLFCCFIFCLLLF